MPDIRPGPEVGDPQVYTVNPDGTGVTAFHPEDIPAAVDAGYKPITDPAEVQKLQHADEVQAKYGGAAGEIASVGLGLVSGASLGTIPAAISAFSPEAKEWIQGHQEANPGFSAASQFVGALAPSALVGPEAEGAEAPGLLGTLARVVSEPSRALTEAGEGIQGAVSGALATPLESEPRGRRRVACDRLAVDAGLTADLPVPLARRPAAKHFLHIDHG